MTAISLLQLVNSSFHALLVQFEDDNGESCAHWDTAFADIARQEYHDRKMASKVQRPAEQMAALSIPFGTVNHVIHRK